MTIIFNSQGYFCEGEITYVQREKVKFGRISLTNDALYFEGGIQHGYTPKNNVGYNVKIPLSQIKKAYKSKKRLLHIFIVETLDNNFFTISFGNDTSLGKKEAKKLAALMSQTMSKSITTQPITTISDNFCTNCGAKRIADSKFCGTCGKEF